MTAYSKDQIELAKCPTPYSVSWGKTIFKSQQFFFGEDDITTLYILTYAATN